MKKLIVIHATKSPDDYKLSPEDIVEMNSQERFQDPMPYHYIVNTDGTILKGRADREVCGHCGRWSVNSLSVAYAGGLSAESGEETDTLSEKQEKGLRTVLENLLKRYTEAEVVGANELLHPDEARENYEPFFDVRKWFSYKTKKGQPRCG
ncbi:MAG: N-acetylmuramoyl-L-alanine amidase [Paludibacteraceae bacterium]|nr:N-acetylmuramoyl-L-alanine amidase [Paludibacteraceae bacterium]